MDDLHRFCARLLGEGPDSDGAEAEARSRAGSGNEALLRAGVLAVRSRLSDHRSTSTLVHRPGTGRHAGLAAAVAAELRAATDTLDGPARELLALRELIGLDYPRIAAATGLEQAAVAPALARARLGLRAALRGPSAPAPECIEHERALDTIARRQDGVEVAAADEDWLIEHLGHCRACGQAHAAMLEASACYRAWAPGDGATDAAAA